MALTISACESSQNSSDLESEVLRHLESHERKKLSGTWVFRDGSLYCDGYLTRDSGEDYCAADIPDDWEAFEFDGETYFRQPLTSR